jgi:ABC-type multidrug transport system fused ATPase/permease subunit
VINKIIKTLSHSERKRLYTISFLTLVAVIFEIFSITLIIPIIKVALDNEFYINFMKEYEFLFPLREIKKEEFLFITVVFYLLIYLFKTLFLTLLSYFKFKFIKGLTENRTLRMMNSYLSQDIQFFNKNHSSFLNKNLVNEILLLSHFYNASIILISESVFLLIIVCVFFIFDPNAFLIILIYALIIAFIGKTVLKSKIQIWGKEREELQSKLSKIILETFGAIREIIIYNKRELFFQKLKAIQILKTRIDVKFSTVNEIPKYFIEFTAVIGFFILGSILFVNTLEKELLLVNLIFFAALMFKSLPSISRIVNSLQQIKFYNSAHDLIENEISKEVKQKSESGRITFYESIILKNIFFKYSNTVNNILEDFSIVINKGEKILIVGESGKGKSTLIDILAGFNKNYKGQFLIDNQPVTDLLKWRNKIGYLAQSFFILDDTIKNNIIMGEEFDSQKLQQVIKISCLENVLSLSKNGIDSVIGERGSKLSGGERQRIGLARALYRNPDLLILDEPTSSLDKKTSNSFINSLLNLDKNLTIIMVSHDDNFRSKFDKIIELK